MTPGAIARMGAATTGVGLPPVAGAEADRP
jgi:hypothetical protein